MKANVIAILVFIGLCFSFQAVNIMPAKADAPAYDLAVEDITFLPAWSSQVLNKQAAITVKVKNAGTADIDAGQYLKNYNYSFENFSASQPPSPSGTLPAGGYFYYNFTGAFNRTGDAKLTFTADPGQSLAETNEDNNYIEKTVSVILSENDLAAESIDVAPASLLLNKDAVITVKVKNNGLKDMVDPLGTGDFKHVFKNFTITDTETPAITIGGPVKAGEYFYYIFKGKFTAIGDAFLSFNIDSDGLLEENSETNNSLEKTVKVVGSDEPDLSIEEFKLENGDSILANSPVGFSVKIKNNGDSSLIDETGLSDDDILLDFQGFSPAEKTHDPFPSLENPLDPGDEFNYGYKGTFSNVGAKILSFKVDKNNKLGDVNPADNATSTPVTIYATERERDDFIFSGVWGELISTTSVKIHWKTDKETTGKINGTVGGEFIDSTTGKEHSATVTGLPNSVDYSYKITGVNGAATKESQSYNVKLPSSDRLEAVGETKAAVDGLNKTVKITWAASLISDGKVYYKKSADSAFIESSADTGKASHEVWLTLGEEGKYDYFTVSTSTPGTVYRSADQAFEMVFTSDKEAEESTAQTNNKESSGSQSAESGSQSSGASADSGVRSRTALTVKNAGLYKSLKGKIILKVESKGEAYWVDPAGRSMYSLGRPDDAFAVMRERGIGIKTAELEKIPAALTDLSGADSDADGLPDALEDALGTDKNKKDTDADGYDDKTEISSGYSPKAKAAKLGIDAGFAAAQKGRILLEVEGHGEAWYINPADGKRYFLGRPADAFSVMRKLGLGISNSNFDSL